MKIPTRRRLTKWQWVLLVTMAVLVLVSSLVDRYLPWFLAQACYLRHMNGVTYMGKVIPVPRGMVEARQIGMADHSAFFIQFPTAMQDAKRGYEWSMFFSRGRLPGETPQAAIRRYGTNLGEFAARTGKSIGPAFAIETQEGKGLCYTTTFIPGKFVSTTCLLFDARWSASYDGSPGREKEFFEVLAGIHDAKK